MKVDRVFVLITSSFPIRNDGSEAAGSFVADLAEELAKQVNVRVVAPGPVTARELWSHQIEIFRYTAPAKPLSTLKLWRPSDFLAIVCVLRTGMAAARAAVSDDATDVLALWGLPCGEWARLATRRRGVGYSVWLLGSDIWSLGRVPVLRNMLARVMRQARHVFADGYKLASDAQLIGNVPVGFLPSTRKIDMVDPLPPRSQSPYRLLFLGRWHPNKGIDLLLDALGILTADDWCRIECVEIQGGGPLESLVRERVAALQRHGCPVKLGGFLAKPAAEDAIARADWVLIPSRIESIPLIFSDAMKLSRPVIVTPVGDLPQLLETYEVGVLADAVGAVAIAKALKFAIRHDAVSYSTAIRNAAAAFSTSAIAECLLQTSGWAGQYE